MMTNETPLRRWLVTAVVQGRDLDDAYDQAMARMGGGTTDFRIDPSPLLETDPRDIEHMEPADYSTDYQPVPEPGAPGTLYVNAYAVTRHMGGSVGDDGDAWWYHVSDALASIPVPATWRATGDGGPELCADDPMDWAVAHLHRTLDHLGSGDICQGGIRIDVEVEYAPAASRPSGASDCGEDPPTGGGPTL